MAQRIQLRRDSAAAWSTANPVLAEGEPGYELDTRKLKFGDGVTPWNSLPYFVTAVAGAGNDPPTLDAPIADQTAFSGAVFSLDTSASFSDPDVGDTLTFTASGLPAGLSINPNTGVISGTIGAGAHAASPYTATVRATDTGALFVEDTFQFTVNQPVNSALLLVFAGESNAAGYAQDTVGPTAGELAVRTNTKILNNTTLQFEDLDVGANNNIDQNLPQSDVHGWEIGIANMVDAGRFSGLPVYIVKTGQSGSRIDQWNTGGTYWTKFLDRINAAKSLLAGLGKTPVPVVLYSQGINDATASTAVATWKAATVAHLAKIRTELGASVPVIMTKFDSLAAQYQIYDVSMDEIDTAENASFAISTAGAGLRDATHWNYYGMLELAERMINPALAGAAPSAPQFSPAPGTFGAAQNVTITSDAGATIRYTTDGSEPHSASTLYTGPVSVAATTTIKAKAFAQDAKSSATVTAAYTITSSATVTWEALLEATDTGGYLTKANGTTAPAGGRGVQTVDATQAFAVIIDNDDANQQAAVVVLDDENSANFNYNDNANAYVFGVFEFGGTVYRTTAGQSSTASGAITKPAKLKMEKSGNDLVLSKSENGGASWTVLHTQAGALAGKSTLWIKGFLHQSPTNASQRVRVAIET